MSGRTQTLEALNSLADQLEQRIKDLTACLAAVFEAFVISDGEITREDMKVRRLAQWILAPVPESVAVIHTLKCWPPSFEEIVRGAKRCEVRKDDRGFQPSDWLRLREYDAMVRTYSGSEAIVKVLYVQPGFGLPEGQVALSIHLLNYQPQAEVKP